MARIRTIKPEFWTSEQVVECSPTARLMFIGMWNFADDAGRLVHSPKRIKMSIFPGDDISSENVLGMLQELSKNGLIDIYAVDGVEYIQVTGWRHQRIDKPQKSNIPGPIQDRSKAIPRTFSESSATEGNGKEGNGRERNSSFQQQQQHSEPRAPAALKASPPPAPPEDPEGPAGIQIVMAAGLLDEAHRHLRTAGRLVGEWKAAGYDLDLDILPAIAEATAAKDAKGERVGSLNYFSKAIADAYARRVAPAATGTAPQRGKQSAPATIPMSDRDRREKQRQNIAEALAKAGIDTDTELGCRQIVVGYVTAKWFEVFREGQPFQPQQLPLDIAWLKQHLNDQNMLLALFHHHRADFARVRDLAEVSGAKIPATFREVCAMLEDAAEASGPPTEYLALMPECPRIGLQKNAA